jgi:CHAT domain-containing protein
LYLSACETAESGGDAVLDETLHIATAFQIAGCPQVIATKWKIPDREGPTATVVRHFYQNMSMKDGKFAVENGAYALHDAIRQCISGSSDEEPDLLALAAYVHIGY